MSYKDLHNMLQTTKLRQHILQLKDKEESIAVMFNNGQFTSFMALCVCIALSEHSCC